MQIARRQSVYPDRNELQLLKEARESKLFFDVTRGRLERALKQKELAEQVMGQNALRRRRLQRERTFNRELQLMRARSEVEVGRLPGLQAAAVRPVDDDYMSAMSEEEVPRPAFLPTPPAPPAAPASRATAVRMIKELQTNRRAGGRGQPLTESERHERIRRVVATQAGLANRFQREDMERTLAEATTQYERRQAT